MAEKKRRTRDPLRESARLARFSPFGGKWYPASSVLASESSAEQVLALLSLLGPCVLSLPWMPPCCLPQVAVGTPLGRGGVRVRPARWQTREVVARLLSPAPSLPLPPVFFNTTPFEQRISIPLAAICSILSLFVCSPPWQSLLFRFSFRFVSPSIGLTRQSCFLLPLSSAVSSPAILSVS